MELLWQNIGVRNEVKLLTAKTFLHLNIVVAQTVFPGNFVAHREVIYSLELVEAFVEVTFA